MSSATEPRGTPDPSLDGSALGPQATGLSVR